MISINISSGFKGVQKELKELAQSLPGVTSIAINRTAQKVKDAQEKEIKDVFDRPNPFTQKAIILKQSNRDNLTASVKLKDQAFKGNPASKYLQSQIAGGERRLKRYEVALRSVGVLPDGYFTAPGEAANMDQYGNIARSQIVQILSYFRANRDVGATSNSTDKTRAKFAKSTNKRYGVSYFVGKVGDKETLGIWQKVNSNFGQAIRPVLIFVQSARYDAIYDFKFVAENVIRREYDNEFVRAFKYKDFG